MQTKAEEAMVGPFRRHALLPDVKGCKPRRQKFRRCHIGLFRSEIADMQAAGNDRMTVWEVLQHMFEAVPDQVQTILTDSGIQVTRQLAHPQHHLSGPMRFDMICETTKRFPCDSHDPLRANVFAACTAARRIRTPNGLTPDEDVCTVWAAKPDRVIPNPIHQMP